MQPLYYKTRYGTLHEIEAVTNAGIYAWFRRLSDDESVLLRISSMTPISDAEALEAARAVLGDA